MKTRTYAPQPSPRQVAPDPALAASRPFAPAAPELRAESGGRPLPAPVREGMERSFGHDFGRVHVHEDDRAGSLDAVALAHGEDLHFAPGTFQPHTAAGRTLLGHELAHVVQQRAGRVAAPGGGGPPVNVDPAHEAEADAAGRRAARGEPAGVEGAPGNTAPAAAAQPAVVQPVLALEGGNNYRRKVRRQMQSLLPAGAFVRTDRQTGEMSMHYAPGAVAAAAGHHGHDLVSRMIVNQHRVRVTPTDTRNGGVIRGVPENPQAPGIMQDPGGWIRHHAYGFAGLFSDQFKQRQALSAAADPQRGSDHQIHYDPSTPDQARQVAVHDPVQGRTETETAPHNTILAHELIHGDRSQRGRLAANPQGFAKFGVYDHVRGVQPGGGHPWWDVNNPTHDQELEEMEEMETVGLPPAPNVKPIFAQRATQANFVPAANHVPDPADITENQIRGTLGLRNRSKYRR
ncbi:MAG TPA: DUF4157 domain-containing protein [Longimicrobiaceae bacterium]|nr:DUF4157 domain-containing protein [Longimicrobiaceae bacterium]